MRSSISTGAVIRAACLAACLGLVVPGIAAATTYYVGPNGSGTNSGLSPSSPLNVSTLNSRLTAGDIAYVLPGTYTTALKPNNHGRVGARITIIGNLANPAAQTFTSGLTTDRSYLTVKGLKFEGAISFIATTPLPLDVTILLLPQDEGTSLRLRSQIVRCVKIMDGYFDIGARFLKME